MPVPIIGCYFELIRTLQTVFKKGHPLKNISVKLFQNLTSIFRGEELLTISSCLCRRNGLPPPKPCFLTDQNFAKTF